MRIGRLTASVAVSLSLVLAACGSDDESTADGPDPSTETASAVVPVAASTDEVDLAALEGDVMLWMWAPW